MLEIGLGWLRWPPDQVFAADVNAILIGYRGDIRRIRAMNGVGEAPEKPPASPEDIRGFFATHRALHEAGHLRLSRPCIDL